MNHQLALGEISLDAQHTDPHFTWISMLDTDGHVAGHLLVETAAIEALGSFEEAKVTIMQALEAQVADRGYDAVAHQIAAEGLRLSI